MNLKNILKKNQIIIYTISFMLVMVGYFNYTKNVNDEITETSVKEISQENNITEEDNLNDSSINLKDNESISDNENKDEIENENNNKYADIGDATLVNSNDVVEDDYFIKSKLERDTMYSQMQESYEKILNSPNSLESQKETASKEISKINEIKNSIMICENLLKTKGFENCVIFVNGANVSVIVDLDDLKQDKTAQIQNIISRELGATIDNIHISIK